MPQARRLLSIGLTKVARRRARVKRHSPPKLDVTGHTAHVRWTHRDRWRRYRRRGNRLYGRWRYRRWTNWWRKDRFYLRRRRGDGRRLWRRRKERASHTRRIRGHGNALRIEWAGGRSGGCGRTHPIWAALTCGIPRKLQTSGIILTGGQIGGQTARAKPAYRAHSQCWAVRSQPLLRELHP